jgi:glucuronoarabinoxylan endo-1,4-beta-xylanase
MKRLILLLLFPLSLAGQATINWTAPAQIIDGFGGSNEGWTTSMSNAHQQFFFGNGTGQLGLSVLRIGQTNGHQDGPGQSCTTVNSGCAGSVIADLQYAASQNVRIISHPWSPPAIYTTNNSTICNPGSGALASGHYGDYAIWGANFYKSLSTYYGIQLYGMGVQNEPEECETYDSALWSSGNIDTFIKTNLGPTFASQSIPALILMPTSYQYSAVSSSGGTCGTDPSCTTYLGVADWHDYDAFLSGGVPPVSPATYPAGWASGKKWWETEASQGPSYGPACGSYSSFTATISDGLCWGAIIDQRMQDGANMWLFWQLIDFNQAGGAGTTSNGSLIANAASGYAVADRAYVLAQYSKFVRPGYYRISATHNPQSGVTVSAYQQTSSNTLVIIATNYTGSSLSQVFNITNAPTFTTLTPTITSATQSIQQLANITVSSQSFTYTIPAQSITTFVSTGSTPTNYSLVVTATNGTISGANCATGTYASGTSIGPCTFTPSAGYTFSSGWSGTGSCSGVSGTGTASCTLSSNATLSASGTSTGCGNYTAASCNQSDVNSAINGPAHIACNGDIISIPAGTCTWTTDVVVTASIDITGPNAGANTGTSTFGSGSNTLTIKSNNPSGPIWFLQPTYNGTSNVTKLESMNLDPINGSTSLGGVVFIEGTSTSAGFPQVRVDNIGFGISTQWTESGNGDNTVDMIRVDDAIGVVDHSTLPTGSLSNHLYTAQMSSYLGVGQFGDNSWAQPDSFGGLTNWFAENNQVNLNGSTFNDCTEAGITVNQSGGCRVVNRFNHSIGYNAFAYTAVHGTDSTGRPRSGRHTETYGNVLTCTLNCGDAVVSFRGGTGIAFGNTGISSGGAYFNQIMDGTTYRIALANPFFGTCGGLTSIDPGDTVDNVTYVSSTLTGGGTTTITDTSKSWTTNQWAPYGAPYFFYDTTQSFGAQITSNTNNTLTMYAEINNGASYNPGDTYKIIRATVCEDQWGRGQGAYISGAAVPTPTAPMNEVLDPAYEWDDTITPASFLGQQFGTNYAGQTIQNRDFYTDDWKAGGLSGPTAQTSTTVPFNGSTTCNAGSGNYTCGVGFGALANRPSSCTTGVGYWATDQGNWNSSGNGFGQGELFKCTSTNTWTIAYIPAQYPHPLIGGSTLVSLTVSTSGSGTGTITGTNSLTGSYTSGTTIGPLTATATGGSTFAGWTVSGNAACSGTTNPCPSFVLTTATTVTATFTGGTSTCGNPYQNPPNYSGTYSTPPVSVSWTSPTSGCSMFMTLDGSAPTCSSPAYAAQSFSTTTTMRVIACQAGYTSSAVEGGTWVITSGVSLTTIASNGYITGTNCATASYVSGTLIGPCTPVANPGYAFSGWSGASGSAVCVGTINPCPQFSLNQASTFTANFSSVPLPPPIGLSGNLIAKQVQLK